jgi:hypothetical protein
VGTKSLAMRYDARAIVHATFEEDDEVQLAEETAAALRDGEYYKWRLTEIMPLFEEARDALTALRMEQCKLHNISLSLAERMDTAGTRTRAEWDAARKEQS